MSDPAVLIAVRASLSGLSGLPTIVWPNQEISIGTPFIVFDTGPTVGAPVTIDGEEFYEFRPQVSYMAELGSFTGASDAALWIIAQSFKHGTRITDADGEYVAKCRQTPTPDGAGQTGPTIAATCCCRSIAFNKSRPL